MQLRILAYQAAVKNKIKHPFANGFAGEDWLQGFLKRNPSISLRKPEGTSAYRASGFNKIVVRDYFSLLQGIMNEYEIKDHRLYNLDESGFSAVPKIFNEFLLRKEKNKLASLLPLNEVSLLPLKFVFQRLENIYHRCLCFPENE